MSLQKISLTLAAAAVGGMVATTVNSAAGLTLTPPSGDTSSTQTATNATVDRDAHSYAPVVPTNICSDPSLPCEPGETHH